MTSREIKAALVLKGVKPKNIAARLGVSPAAVTRVIQSQSVSARIRLAVAQAIGKKVNDIWPEQAA